MNKYILIGIPNCGKSTLGRRVSEILQLSFFDTDTMARDMLKIENPIDLFRTAFNGQILLAQQKAIYELAALDSPAIIATGAEVALIPECAKLMKCMGTIIHIERKLENAIDGLKNNESRLVLRNVTNGTEIDMQEKAVKLYAQELSQYEALADLTLENDDSEDEGVEKLINIINSISQN